jgi:transcriptional regulator with XRE-family HTH domain
MTTATARPPVAGALLRDWRERRRLSQLDLANLADTSTRHLSFVETGRSRPSREMVLKLGQALQMPLSEQNQVLLAAGHSPEYPTRDATRPPRGTCSRCSTSPWPPMTRGRRSSSTRTST